MRLREHFGPNTDPRITLQDEEAEQRSSDFSSQVLDRLSHRRGVYGRYRFRGEITRGGMGATLRGWDEDLRRSMAGASHRVVSSPGGSRSEA